MRQLAGGEKAAVQERIRQLEAFQKEMQNFQPVFPTVTFGKTHVIKDKDHELHVEFHGRAHTAGDVVVYCPQKRVVATGDMVLGSLPFMGDCYPQDGRRPSTPWPNWISRESAAGTAP